MNWLKKNQIAQSDTVCVKCLIGCKLCDSLHYKCFPTDRGFSELRKYFSYTPYMRNPTTQFNFVSLTWIELLTMLLTQVPVKIPRV